MLRSIFIALAVAAAGLVAMACATRPRVKPEYPPRRPGCSLMISHADLPEVPAWDDLGNVEVICHIDEMEATCFGRLRAEVCRMGGDIVYHLPRKLWRPRDEAMGFRGKVAHTRSAPLRDAAPSESDAFPPPASAEELAGPVVPLTGPGAPAPVGGGGDAGHD
jgi:hypothetical protein